MLATGAGVALGSHALKSGARAMMNTSPEPFSNWTASVGEDVAVVGALSIAFAHPWLALSALAAFTLGAVALLWWVWRRLARLMPRPRAG